MTNDKDNSNLLKLNFFFSLIEFTFYICLCLVGIYALIPALGIVNALIYPELDGKIKDSDCRQTIQVDNNPFGRFWIRDIAFKDFVCEEFPYGNGKLCKTVVLENNTCQKVYFYLKPPVQSKKN